MTTIKFPGTTAANERLLILQRIDFAREARDRPKELSLEEISDDLDEGLGCLDDCSLELLQRVVKAQR